MRKAAKTDCIITTVVLPQPLKYPEKENMAATNIQSKE